MARKRRSATPAESSRLWAPWRHGYQMAASRGLKTCIFCLQRLSPSQARRRLILHADPLAVVMLNRYPYNNCHLMVAPRAHRGSPELLTSRERMRLDELIVHAIAQLRSLLNPDGFNVGANLGRAAGAGFADHMHWHIVPRWIGDNNFMPAVAQARVLSMNLEQAFDLLAPRFKAIDTAVS